MSCVLIKATFTKKSTTMRKVEQDCHTHLSGKLKWIMQSPFLGIQYNAIFLTRMKLGHRESESTTGTPFSPRPPRTKLKKNRTDYDNYYNDRDCQKRHHNASWKEEPSGKGRHSKRKIAETHDVSQTVVTKQRSTFFILG